MDDNDRPLVVKPLDYGIQAYEQKEGPITQFMQEQMMPAMFSDFSGNDDLVDLESQGWKML